MKRTASILTLLGLALLLAACQEPLPSFIYEGTTTTGGVDQPLTLQYEQRGNLLTGEYLVRAAKGTFHGMLDGTAITASLTPGSTCTFTFEGVLTGTGLAGGFEPTDCPGGQPGTWALELQ